MPIDEHRMLTNLLDAFDRLHDGMIEASDVAALLFASSRALVEWPYVEEMVAAERAVRQSGDRASDVLQPLRVRIAEELEAAGPKPRHRI
ncbi:hypothetical protein JIG36_33935 [Actinoplanes sp. LDG1-06]|uniref:Uncharacterized protein n=1 Tax=Paractinoplanes ovalisporus TaxID=2810368 RepID=A0ABS2AMA2_9ACTN|nr:hypothetical protein [Actinoplanes ovalisporus]MBM2620513.1 hypothetical protein [Actinoplanes ovalisporus]